MQLRKESRPTGCLGGHMTLWVVLLTLGAASLRLFHLGLKSFWGDEAFSIALAEFRWADFRHVLASSEANMALYYLLLRIWSQISDVPWFVRLLSVLAGIATVPAIYFAGKTLFSRRAGIIAALLLALNIFHIRYSQEARSYSLVVLLVTCSSLFFVRNIKSQGRSGGVLYVLSSAAALYAHFFAALVLLAQLVSWMLLPRRLRTWAYARYLIAIAVIGFPLVLFIASQGVSHLDWVSHPTTRDVYRLFIYFSGNGVTFVLFLLAIALASREWWLQRSDRESFDEWSFVFTVLWLLLPILVTLVVSHWKPIFFARFLLVCLPASLLLFGQGLALIRPNRLGLVAVAVVVCASLVSLTSFYRQPGQEDWKGAINYLAQNASAGDVLIFASQYCRFPFDYNLRMSGTRLPPMRLDPGSVDTARDVAPHAQHLWVLCGNESLTTGNVGPKGVPGFRFLGTQRFPGAEIQEFESVNEARPAPND